MHELKDINKIRDPLTSPDYFQVKTFAEDKGEQDAQDLDKVDDDSNDGEGGPRKSIGYAGIEIQEAYMDMSSSDDEFGTKSKDKAFHPNIRVPGK